MPTDLTIQHTSDLIPVNGNRLINISNWLLKQCDVGGHTISILLVDDDKIRQLNHQYRHKDKPTNVLSFPFADGADESIALIDVRELGDIIISVDTALRESIEYG